MNAPARSATPVLSVVGLTKDYPIRGKRSLFRRTGETRRVVSDVSFDLKEGEVLGIVGESGSGKTTVARMILRLVEPSSGQVLLRGRSVLSLSAAELRSLVRPTMRMIFQDPDAALNPGYTIGFGLTRAMEMQPSNAGGDATSRVAVLLERVGLDASFASKYPDELSGGEKRRVGICRALATDPKVIVADEPLSGLDVVLQETILELLAHEKQRRGFALILVSHDLDRVNQVCDRVMVMYGGRVVEQALLKRGAEPVRDQYRHPYSILLQQARVDLGTYDAKSDFRDADPEPAGASAARGCAFAGSCALRRSLGDPRKCWDEVPMLAEVAADHSVACHFVGESLTAGTVEFSRRAERAIAS